MRWDLLDRYNAGECDPAERAEVERWLAEKPIRRRVLEELAAALAADPSAQAKAAARRRLAEQLRREGATEKGSPAERMKDAPEPVKKPAKGAKKKPGSRKRKDR